MLTHYFFPLSNPVNPKLMQVTDLKKEKLLSKKSGNKRGTKSEELFLLFPFIYCKDTK